MSDECFLDGTATTKDMPAVEPRPTRKLEPADPRDRRVYVWWAVGFGFLLVLGLICWQVARPALETRAAVRHFTSDLSIGEGSNPSLLNINDEHEDAATKMIAQLGGPQRTADRMTLFLRMPEWFTGRDRPREPGSGGKACAVRLLGYCGKPGVGPLILALKSSQPAVRWYAAKAIFRIGPDAGKAAPALSALIFDQSSFQLRSAEERSFPREKAIMALGALGPQARCAAPALAEALTDNEQSVRVLAAEAIYNIGAAAKEAESLLWKARQHPDAWTRVYVNRALIGIGVDDPRPLDALIEALHPDWRKAGEDELVAARDAATFLGEMGAGARKAIPALLRAFQGKNPIQKDGLLMEEYGDYQEQAGTALCRIGRAVGGPEAAQVLSAMVKKIAGRQADTSTIEALGEWGPAAKAAIPALMGAMRSDNEYVRSAAAEALKKIRDEGAKQ